MMFIENTGLTLSVKPLWVYFIQYSLDFEVVANYSLQCEYSEQHAIILVSHREMFRSLHTLTTSNFFKVTETDKWSQCLMSCFTLTHYQCAMNVVIIYTEKRAQLYAYISLIFSIALFLQAKISWLCSWVTNVSSCSPNSSDDLMDYMNCNIVLLTVLFFSCIHSLICLIHPCFSVCWRPFGCGLPCSCVS